MKSIHLFIVAALTVLSLNTQAQEEITEVNEQKECSCMDSSHLSYSIDQPGNKILAIGKQVALVDKTVIKGSCWTFVNEIYRRAGSADDKTVVFRSKKAGPYANAEMVKPGDWIYHINHSYNNVEHSAIFVCWKDFANRIAITLSYAGMNRNIPGKYGSYKLNNIYSIFRPTAHPEEDLSKTITSAN